MTPLQNKIEEAKKRFDKEFEGFWLDGMHDYENDITYDEEETIEKIKQFLSQELTSIATFAQEEARKETQKLIWELREDCRNDGGIQYLSTYDYILSIMPHDISEKQGKTDISRSEPSRDDWEKEFEYNRPKTDDKLLSEKTSSEDYPFGYKFCEDGQIHEVTDWGNIKEFIRQTLLSERTALVEEILKELPPEIEIGVDIPIRHEDYVKSWNDYRKAVITLLTNKK